MIDQELDRVMRRVLLDALKAEEEQNAGPGVPFAPSARYRRSMGRMRRNPLQWARNRARPVWRRALRQAAIIALVIAIGFGVLMTTVPPVRAAVLQWVTEWYETHIVYRYHGDDPSEPLPKFAITALPDGFAETERTDLAGSTSVIYQDEAGNVICLDYGYMHQGGVMAFHTENNIVTDLTVNGMAGRFFESEMPNYFNSITWIDTELEIQFLIMGTLDQTVLLHMAESVSAEK